MKFFDKKNIEKLNKIHKIKIRERRNKGMMIEITGNRMSGKSVMAYEIMSNINLKPIIVDANKQQNQKRLEYVIRMKEIGIVTGTNLFRGVGVGNILQEEDFHFGKDEIYLFEIDDYPKDSIDYKLMKKAILAAMEAGANIIYTKISLHERVRVRVLV